ncbi:MAG: nitroreductase [Desulfobacteraceae bacterium]|nr:nitroreductase [Desulfobacteraceae bacterium]MBU4002407.1 nitroreductase [Pseudomonadota bacterium]MBU4054562.1 nitroreductase [Pseudomonadota bacterium]
MELKEAIKTRKSIRGFKKDPVPKQVLAEIIEISLRAPSAMNVQPWEVIVVTGKALDDLCKGNMDLLTSGKAPVSDFGHSSPYEGIYKERQRTLGFGLYSLLGIQREDKEKRTEWTLKGFRSFDAPASIILAADQSLETRIAASDIGGFVQTICLVALDYGLGTCINGQGITFPEVVRKVTGLSESKKLHTSIAIGYPDWEHPANKLDTVRESIENVVTWVGFD